MRKHIILFFLCLFLAEILYGQQELMDNYVQYALEQNTTVRMHIRAFDKSRFKLQEIKSHYLPILSFKSRYSRAFGGRVFEIPVGDVLNPVYQNINLLNAATIGQDPSFPLLPAFGNIPNDEVNFLRRQEHETYLRVVFPIFNPSLNNSRQLQEHQLKIEEKEVELLKKHTGYEVKKAYYNFQQVKALQQSLQNALTLVRENLHTASSLFEHHKVTIDYVYSAEVELKALEKEIAQAEQKEKLTQAYFNLLLNRRTTTAIPVTSLSPQALRDTLSLNQALVEARQNRLEFNQLELALSMADQKIKMEKADRLPQINFVGDYGFQGADYSFGSKDDYGIGSVVLSWDLVDLSQKAREKQARIDKDLLGYRQEALKNRIEMEVLEAYYNLATAKKNIELAQAKKESAGKAYRLVNRKFKQGQANMVEITSARIQLTNAEQEIIMARFDYRIKQLDLDEAIGK